MLDEPTAGLDAASEADMLSLIRTLHQLEKKTVLWVHHRLDQCAAFSQQVCWVDKQSVRLRALSEVLS